MPTEDPTKSDVLKQNVQETEKVEGQTVSEDQLKSISGGIISPVGDSDGGTCIF